MTAFFYRLFFLIILTDFGDVFAMERTPNDFSSFERVPPEIKLQIAQYIPPADLRNLMATCRAFRFSSGFSKYYESLKSQGPLEVERLYFQKNSESQWIVRNKHGLFNYSELPTSIIILKLNKLPGNRKFQEQWEKIDGVSFFKIEDHFVKMPKEIIPNLTGPLSKTIHTLSFEGFPQPNLLPVAYFSEEDKKKLENIRKNWHAEGKNRSLGYILGDIEADEVDVNLSKEKSSNLEKEFQNLLLYLLSYQKNRKKIRLRGWAGDTLYFVKFIESLKSKENSLVSLELFNSNLKEAEAAHIANALGGNTVLTTLSLFLNTIKDSGASLIAKMLAKNKTLTTLSLGFNGIKDSGASRIAKMLKKNKTLTTLNLAGNKIQGAGASCIANALKKNFSGVRLFMNSNPIGKGGVSKLVYSMQTNPSLRILDLSGIINDPSKPLDLSCTPILEDSVQYFLQRVNQEVDKEHINSRLESEIMDEGKTFVMWRDPPLKFR